MGLTIRSSYAYGPRFTFRMNQGLDLCIRTSEAESDGRDDRGAFGKYKHVKYI